MTNPADAPLRRSTMDPEGDELDLSSELLAMLKAKFACIQQVVVPSHSWVLRYQSEEQWAVPGHLECAAALEWEHGMDYSQSLNCRSRALLCLNGTNAEADHLLDLVKVQYLTRACSKVAVHDEQLMQEPSIGLCELVAAVQTEDAFCQQVVKDLKQDPLIRQSYHCTDDGVLLYRGRLVVPNQRSLMHELLRLYHDEPTAGHWGVQKIMELLQRKFKWEGIKTDIKEYICICPICQGNSAPRYKPYGQLEPLPPPSRPWKEISIDLITHLPVSQRGTNKCNAILTIVDRYTKMAVFLPICNAINAADLAELIYQEVELQFGVPTGITLD